MDHRQRHRHQPSTMSPDHPQQQQQRSYKHASNQPHQQYGNHHPHADERHSQAGGGHSGGRRHHQHHQQQLDADNSMDDEDNADSDSLEIKPPQARFSAPASRHSGGGGSKPKKSASSSSSRRRSEAEAHEHGRHKHSSKEHHHSSSSRHHKSHQSSMEVDEVPPTSSHRSSSSQRQSDVERRRYSNDQQPPPPQRHHHHHPSHQQPTAASQPSYHHADDGSAYKVAAPASADQSDAERALEDLRSRLLSKRNKYEAKRAAEHQLEAHAADDYHEPQQQPQHLHYKRSHREKHQHKADSDNSGGSASGKRSVIDLDSPEPTQLYHSSSKRSGRNGAPDAEPPHVMDAVDVELQARRARLLGAVGRKDAARDELEARRVVRARRDHEPASIVNVDDLLLVQRAQHADADEDSDDMIHDPDGEDAKPPAAPAVSTHRRSGRGKSKRKRNKRQQETEAAAVESDADVVLIDDHDVVQVVVSDASDDSRDGDNSEDSDASTTTSSSSSSSSSSSGSGGSSTGGSSARSRSADDDDDHEEGELRAVTPPSAGELAKQRRRRSDDSRHSGRSPPSRSRSASRSPPRHHHDAARRTRSRSASRSRSRSRSPHSRSRSRSRSRSAARKRSRSVSSDYDHTRTKRAPTAAATRPPSPPSPAPAEPEPEPEAPPAPPTAEELRAKLPHYYPGVQGCRSVEEFQCLNRIEEGTYGVVYRARDKRTEEIVALKRLKMEKEKEGFPITSLREINTLLKGQHPNIVTVREIVVGSNMDKIFIVMDYVEHDLKSLMETMRHRKQAFVAGEVKCLTQQLLRAVGHLHDNWILHRDLKTSNLLLSHKGILKVGDFGLAREYGSPLKPYTSVVVTLWYRAPELLLCCKEYSHPIDMWSVGCIFAEFLAMAALFPGKSEVDQLSRIFKDLGTPNENIWPGYSELPAVQKMTFTEYPVSHLRKKFAHLTSELGLQLLQGLLTYDPKQRFSAEQALRSPYFRELPLPIDPAMFPTWPAKSELGARKALAASPKPPSGGGQYKQLQAGEPAELMAASGGGGGGTAADGAPESRGFVLNFGHHHQHHHQVGGFTLK